MKQKWAKRLCGLLLTGVLLLQPVTGVFAENTQKEASGATLYEEDFEDGSAEGWSTDVEVNQEENGNHVWKIGGDWPRPILNSGNQDWTDYTVEADFRVDSWNETTDGTMAPYQGFGISPRVSGSGYWSALYREKTHKLELFKTPGGMQDSADFTVNVDVWYTLKMVMSGKQVTVYMYEKDKPSSEPIFEFTDEGNSFPYGGVAIEMVYANLSVDNIKVTEIIRTVPVESVSLNYTDYALQKDSSFQLESTVLPEKGTNKEVVWSSSDETVASVDEEGKVTGLSSGFATITAASVENPAIQAKCVVEVFENVSEQTAYYVATNGSDENDGTEEKPFATIEKARNEIRKQLSVGQQEDIVVYIRGGTYYLDEEIILNETDSGNNGHTVTYRNYPEEEVRLVGGTPVTDWSDADGDGIYEADVSENNDFWTLFDNGERMTSARDTNWQNKDFPVGKDSHVQAVYRGAWFGEDLFRRLE